MLPLLVPPCNYNAVGNKVKVTYSVFAGLACYYIMQLTGMPNLNTKLKYTNECNILKFHEPSIKTSLLYLPRSFPI